MKRFDSHDQPDLFAVAYEKPPLFHFTYPERMLKTHRPAMHAMLKKVQDATEFPFPNLTVAMTEEMSFNSTARMFPPEEGMALLEAYAAAIPRVYALINEPWWPLYHSALLKTCSNDPAKWQFIKKYDDDFELDDDGEPADETDET